MNKLILSATVLGLAVVVTGCSKHVANTPANMEQPAAAASTGHNAKPSTSEHMTMKPAVPAESEQHKTASESGKPAAKQPEAKPTEANATKTSAAKPATTEHK